MLEVITKHCPVAEMKYGFEQSASFCSSGYAVSRSASPGVKLLDKRENGRQLIVGVHRLAVVLPSQSSLQGKPGTDMEIVLSK